MRDFRDAKAMARALRHALKAKGVETTHSESLELISAAFGYENWNILSAKIGAAVAPGSKECSPLPGGTQNDSKAPKTLYCSFCGKSQHDVRKLIAGPEVLICDECVELCTDIVEPVDDIEFFRLMKGNQGSEGRNDTALLELARATSTEELAHYMERSRKGVERNRLALQGIQRRLAIQDGEAVGDGNISTSPRDLKEKRRQDLIALQQKAQRELKRYEDALHIATTALNERRQ